MCGRPCLLLGAFCWQALRARIQTLTQGVTQFGEYRGTGRNTATIHRSKGSQRKVSRLNGWRDQNTKQEWASALRLSRDHMEWERLRRTPKNNIPSGGNSDYGDPFRPRRQGTPSFLFPLPSQMDPAPWQSVSTNNVDPQSKPWLVQWCPNSWKFIADPVQTGSGGNDKSGIDSGSYSPVPTAPQPLDVFVRNVGTFDCTRYMVLNSLKGPVHPSESTQGLYARREAFMCGPREE